MAKQTKKPADLNRLASSIVDEATAQRSEVPESAEAAAGRVGGEVGGKVRAERLSPERRREIARAAANARWKNSSD